MVKNLPAMQETWVQSLGWEDPLGKGMTIHSSILAWRISWTEEPAGLQFMGSQRVGHDWVTELNWRKSERIKCCWGCKATSFICCLWEGKLIQVPANHFMLFNKGEDVYMLCYVWGSLWLSMCPGEINAHILTTVSFERVKHWKQSKWLLGIEWIKSLWNIIQQWNE